MPRSLLAGLLAALALAGAAAADGSAASCRHGNPDTRWKAVFAHFSQRSRAVAFVTRLRANGGFQTSVENVGCGDYAVVVPDLNSAKQRKEFTQEAMAAGYPGVSFQTASTDTLSLPSGTWRAVFGTFRTVEEASALQQRAAERGFRIIDIEFAGPRRWRVTVFGVPQEKSQEFAREARVTGFEIMYEIT